MATEAPKQKPIEKLDAVLEEVGARHLAPYYVTLHQYSVGGKLLVVMEHPETGGFEVLTPLAGSNEIQPTLDAVRQYAQP